MKIKQRMAQLAKKTKHDYYIHFRDETQPSEKDDAFFLSDWMHFQEYKDLDIMNYEMTSQEKYIKNGIKCMMLKFNSEKER